MQMCTIGQTDLETSRLVYGCMRIAGDHSPAAREKGKTAIRAALDAGYNHFDHADIYGEGSCEQLFGEILKESPSLRDQMILTSKCGIFFKDRPNPGDPGRYDFTQQHILESVEGILGRLGVEYIDMLLLHRPDYLMNPAEVSEILLILQDQGKVKHFGVSNFSPSQVSLLQSVFPQPLHVNQVEVNIHHIAPLTDGTLDQCMEYGMSPQAWCPLGGVVYPAWGTTFSEEDDARIKKEFDRQAKKYETEPWIIMLAWILMHPSHILPIIGSTTPSRITAAKAALDLEYDRKDWYHLLEARNGHPVP